MEFIADLLTDAAPNVHIYSFFLLSSACVFPISEDVVFLVSSSIAATIIPENSIIIFIGCFAGAYVSDILAYLIGRFAGIKLIHSPFMKKRIPTHKILKIEHYFLKYGGKTLFFGRFIPFGVRNILFLTSGLVRLSPIKFLTIDFLALIFTSAILFSLGYSFGSNYREVQPYLDQYKYVIFGIFIFLLLFFYVRNRRHSNKPENI